MDRGLGWVQLACLHSAKQHERKRWPPTTYAIAADVYQIKPDRNGDRLISDAQHGAVRRALEGLQRKGMVIGFRDTFHARNGRIELCHIWMTEKGLARWLAKVRADNKSTVRLNPVAAVREAAQVNAIKARARAIGMKV